jgi:hypothetical protein
MPHDPRCQETSVHKVDLDPQEDYGCVKDGIIEVLVTFLGTTCFKYEVFCLCEERVHVCKVTT